MSKYDPLWEYVQKTGKPSLQLQFDEIDEILHFPIDHSFLRFKKELLAYGYQVKTISMKHQTITFDQISK